MHCRYNDNQGEKIMTDITKTEGLIYNIQRYSLHDGPGIRTIVFLKGCPLRCPWCANPESQRFEKEKMGNEEVGRLVTVKEVIDVVKRDMPFYKRSGGGMTLSGGEPLMQPDFSKALVQAAKNIGINVAIETSGYQEWDRLWEVMEHIDFILYDIKAMDSSLHMELLNVNNDLILRNLEKLVNKNKQVIVRVPVIPQCNDSFLNLSETVQYCKSIGIKEIHFLPYHQLGVPKYEKLNREYSLKNLGPLDKEKLITTSEKLQDKYEVVIKVF